MAAMDNTMPIQLSFDSFSLNNKKAARVLNNTIPILLIGMMAELLPAYALSTPIKHQMEK